MSYINHGDLLTPVIIEELLLDDKGSPMAVWDVFNAETGKVHPLLLSKIPISREITIGIDGVRIKRYALKSEILAMTKDLDGDGDKE